jgi:hypothetical protein
LPSGIGGSTRGSYRAESKEPHCGSAFLFPQLVMQVEQNRSVPGAVATECDKWFPNFVDYLFIAFNTSTAFSPTDTPPLTRWAKGLMMVQSIISLMIVVLLAARAVNIL